MDFFQHGFLAGFVDTLFAVSLVTLNNFVIFAVVAVVALDISRRINRYGTTIAILMIVGAALYVTGVTTLLVW